ncbi:MAG: B12-binding domain-containing radical SAM protein [Chloroflexi bacterium]|nr:B12-binding domain-containing radical SAM protein [Chloroflexota bacterium]
MSKILFGQSYYLRFDPKLWEAMQPYPPLGTMYAASYMRELGYEVALFDAMLADSEEGWGQALDHEQPRYAIIYEDNFNYLSKMCLLRMRAAAFEMISMAKQRDCTVIVCGSDATDNINAYLGCGADFVLVGEGEYTLEVLLQQLSGNADTVLESILGLAYMDGEQLKVNPPRPDIIDLDELPFPAWDLVDIERYRHIWLDRHGYYSMNMVTTRGCPFHCNWCAKPIWGQRYNARSPENVVAEMKWLKENFKPDHIWFADDIMGLKPNWTNDFAKLVESNNAKIPFKSLHRADLLLRENEVDSLKRSGCQIVWIGAESGSQKILDAMDKGTQVEQIHAAGKLVHQAEMQIGFFLQFGYPGETKEDIEKTLQMVRDCDPDDIGISVSYPLPGTPFFHAVKDQLGSKKNWVDSNDLDMLYNGPFPTLFYRKLHTVVHKEFRARKTWKKLSRLEWAGLRQTFAMPYHWLTLPFARRGLNKLAESSFQGINKLPQLLSPEEAAQPSTQE